MPKKFLIVPAMSLAVAVLISGCSMFSGTSGSSANLDKIKTVGKTVLKVVCTAYKSGGNSLAYAEIDKLVADGKLTSAQAVDLKSSLDGGVDALDNLANAPDTASTVTTIAMPASSSVASQTRPCPKSVLAHFL